MLEPVSSLVASDADLNETRAAFERLQAEFVPPSGTSVRPVTAGWMPSLVAWPADGPEPTVLYLHGGGYVVGSALGSQPHASALAAAAQNGVLVSDYRLASEHPFPAAVDHALSAYRWLAEQGVPPERVTAAGDAAGGGLVMSLLLTLNASPSRLLAWPFCSAPGSISRSAMRTLRRGAAQVSGPMTSVADTIRCAEAYLNGHLADDPVVDPLLAADLVGLPPMLVQAATGDACLAEAELLAAGADTAGVRCPVSGLPGAIGSCAFTLTRAS